MHAFHAAGPSRPPVSPQARDRQARERALFVAFASCGLMYMYFPTATMPPHILEISFQEFRQGPLKQRKVCAPERGVGRAVIGRNQGGIFSYITSARLTSPARI